MKDSDFSLEGWQDEKGVRPQDYITRAEYERHLGIIESAVSSTLIARDTQFGGTDGIEAVLIAGSYARSHRDFSERVWVHNRSPRVKASDLDIIHILSLPPNQQPRLSEEQLQAHREAVRKSDYRKAEDILFHDPQQGFPIALARRLRGMKLPISVAYFSDDLDLNDPREHWAKELANDLTDKDCLLHHGGLLFVTPDSQFREQIVQMLQVGNLPIIMNPATESLKIK